MTSAGSRRFRFLLCLSLSIIAALCLVLWRTTGSAARAAVEPMPALQGNRAISYLKDRGLYDSLQSAASPMFTQLRQLTAPDGQSNNFFGNAVAIDGDTAIVGASPVGAVYVFIRAGGLWSLQQKLQVAGGAFGISVAISGNTLVGGASFADASTGAAYVYVRAGGVWSQQQRLIASDRAANDNFGIAVGISGDTVVVGARFHGAGPNPQQGSAYVYVRAGGVWSEQQHLTANDGGAAEFYGDGVAISGDTIVVAAAGIDQVGHTEPGSAYVYVRAGGVWNQQQRLTSNAASPTLFGSSVTVNGDTIVVGALFESSAYVFERAGGVWSQPQKLTKALEEFGIAAAISGETIVVGARHFNRSQGAAYVFVKSGGVWSEQQQLTASDGADNDRFGNSVGISGDTIVIGSPFDQVGENMDQGSAYLFTPNGPPAISASSVTVQQGRALNGASIATVSDNETAPAQLTVAVVSGGTATGVTLTNIANAGGAITARVAASCTATGGTIRLRVTDGGGLTNTADLQVNVTPNDPPVITCPNSIVKATDPGQCSAVVAFTATASDDCDGALVPTCTPPSGSTFAKGTITVTCSVSDSAGHVASRSFPVTINDTQSPTLNCPQNITVPTALNTCAAPVSFTPAATDNCAIQSVGCSPPSGTVFPKGISTVTCTAVDTSSNSAACSFTITVIDTQKPTIACPANLTVLTARPGDLTIVVNYAAPTAADNCAVQNIICTPPSGAALPLGVTTVTCTATDTSGNSAGCSFTVTVFDICLQDDTDPGAAIVWNSLTGDYRFCCTGGIYVGRGAVSRRGNVFTLIHSPADRRLTASLDSTQNRGTAALQAPPGANRCMVNDRDIRNNTCQCALTTAGPSAN